MKIENFRQFYGAQTLDFAVGGESGRNVTVVHGFNGAGKTALLNAFIWCLYGETTPDLEDPERLHNESAVEEAEVGDELAVSVVLEFETPDARYRIGRTRKCVKKGTAELSGAAHTLELYRIDDTGNFSSVGKNDDLRQKKIEQFLPKTLYPFFFFNGERVEKLASADAYDDVEAGVKTLLDVEIFERGHHHLSSTVARALRDELQALGGGEIKIAIEDLKKLEAEADEYQISREQYTANIKAINQEIADIKQIQGEIEAAAELVKKENRLSEELKTVDEGISDAKIAMAKSLSKNGYLAFGATTLERTNKLVLEARQRGEIPAKIKPQFVDDLIAQGQCVCGRPIDNESAEYTNLMDWRNTTGLAEFEEQINQTAAQIRPLLDRRSSYYEDLDVFNEKISTQYSRRQEIRDELDLIREQLGDGARGEDAAKLQQRIGQLEIDRSDAMAEVKLCGRSLSDNAEQQEDLNRKIKKLQVQDDRANAIQRQLDAVDKVANAFKEIALVQKDDVRAGLSASIREIWEDAAIKDYTASVSKDYRLQLTKRVGSTVQPVVGASTGEKQVLALSFVGSLVKKARENASRNQDMGFGGHYPLVMDSAFGNLEDDYRAAVAEWVPKLADQVVVIVSMSQWRDEVETAMRDRIGREYILELHTSKTGKDRNIQIQGEPKPYVVSSNDPTERTEIRRV